MKEAAQQRESPRVSSDKPSSQASPAPLSSPLVAAENSPAAAAQSNLLGSFRSPFHITIPPDVFNSPSVRCTGKGGAEPSRRRPSPFPHHHAEHYGKRMKLSDLTDGRGASSEYGGSLNPLSPSALLSVSPLSPIRSPTSDDTTPTLHVPPQRNLCYYPPVPRYIADSTPDAQVVNSSSGTEPDSETRSSPELPSSPSSSPPPEDSLVPLPPDELRSPHHQSQEIPGSPDISGSPELSESSEKASSPDISGSPELPASLSCHTPGSPSHTPGLPHDTPGSGEMSGSPKIPGSSSDHTPGSPELPASLPSPVASSRPSDPLQLPAVVECGSVEPEIHRRSSLDSETCSSTSLPSAAADLARSDAEAELVDDDREITDSGGKTFESKADTEAADDSQEAHLAAEMS